MSLRCIAQFSNLRLFGPFAFGPQSDQEELMRAVVSRLGKVLSNILKMAK